MEQGWILIHRKLKNSGYWNKSQYIHLWLHVLLSANHEDRKFLWNGTLEEVKKGQFLTGRKELSKETGIPESTIEDILKLFERQHQIQQQKTSKYRLITVLNWKTYQSPTSKATTKQQQSDTNKELKELKEVNNSFSNKKEKTFKKMTFNKYNEGNSSDSYEKSIDLDSGEEIGKKEPKKKVACKYIKDYFISKIEKKLKQKIFLGNQVDLQIYRLFNIRKMMPSEITDVIDWWVEKENDPTKVSKLSWCLKDENINDYKLTKNLR